MKSKRLWVVLVAFVGLVVYVGNVLATPSTGYTSTTLAKAQFGELDSHLHSVPADWQNQFPSAAMDRNGDALVVWGATNGNSLGETRAAFAPAGQGFQSPVQIGATYDGSTGDAYPFAAFDGAGNAIMFWEGSDNRVYYAVRPAAQGFSAARQVPHAASDAAASHPAYAVADNGEVEERHGDGVNHQVRAVPVDSGIIAELVGEE